MSLWGGGQTWTPTARTEELLVEELGDELLVYDQRNDQVHCLGPDSRRVWRACDGTTSVDQLDSALNLDSGLVVRALDELEACGLLEADEADRVTRREAGKRLAEIGAAAAVAPLIYSIAAPTPALAATAVFCSKQGTNGCITSTTVSKGCASATACSSVGCVCCFASPPKCGGTNYSTCLAACSTTTCNQAVLEQRCPASVAACSDDAFPPIKGGCGATVFG
jgi:hypothetical protein